VTSDGHGVSAQARREGRDPVLYRAVLDRCYGGQDDPVILQRL